MYDDGSNAAAAAEGKERANTPPIRERTPRREKEKDHSPDDRNHSRSAPSRLPMPNGPPLLPTLDADVNDNEGASAAAGADTGAAAAASEETIQQQGAKTERHAVSTYAIAYPPEKSAKTDDGAVTQQHEPQPLDDAAEYPGPEEPHNDRTIATSPQTPQHIQKIS